MVVNPNSQPLWSQNLIEVLIDSYADPNDDIEIPTHADLLDYEFSGAWQICSLKTNFIG